MLSIIPLPRRPSLGNQRFPTSGMKTQKSWSLALRLLTSMHTSKTWLLALRISRSHGNNGAASDNQSGPSNFPFDLRPLTNLGIPKVEYTGLSMRISSSCGTCSSKRGLHIANDMNDSSSLLQLLAAQEPMVLQRSPIRFRISYASCATWQRLSIVLTQGLLGEVRQWTDNFSATRIVMVSWFEHRYLVGSARLVPQSREVVAGVSIVKVDQSLLYGQAAGRAVTASG